MKDNSTLFARIWQYRYFYLMFIPTLVILWLFNYLPMLGIRFAFTQFTPFRGPDWIGFDNFERLWSTRMFWNSFRNTLEISLINLGLSMIFSVVLALLINEVRHMFWKRTIQTVVYLPHFLSWVVVASIFAIILSPQNGMVNEFLISMGILQTPIYFFAEEGWWRFVYYVVSRWKDTGWGTVIFLATLTSISPELYEAANIDGANRWKQTLYITLPSIATTIVIVLILNLAKVLNLFESVLVMYNDLVLNVADVIQTYNYRAGIIAALPDYGFTTAVGLFRSVVACVLVVGSNWISKKIRGSGII